MGIPREPGRYAVIIVLLSGICLGIYGVKSNSAYACGEGSRERVTDRFFGLHLQKFNKSTEWPRLKFGSWRLWDSAVAWPHLQPSEKKWDFKRLDGLVEEAVARDIDILLPLGLTPTWASSRPGEKSAYGRNGWAAPATDQAAWENYVFTVATRYKEKVNLYEIWNEPNRDHFFSGTVDQMVALTCSAAKIIKDINPQAQIVSPGATGKAKGVKWLRDFLEAGGGECVDIIGFHFYVNMNESPEALCALVGDVRETILSYELADKPLWNTETGWLIEHADRTLDAKWRVLTQVEARSYIIRAYLLGRAAGLSRFFWYAYDSRKMGRLIEPDSNDEKLAAQGFSTAYQWLLGAEVSSCVEMPKSIWSCQLEDEHGESRYIVWSEQSGGELPWKSQEGSWTVESINGEIYELEKILNGGTVTLTDTPILIRRRQ